MKNFSRSTFYILHFIFVISFFSCSVNKAKTDNSLKKYFEENKVDGCFTMLNNADGKVTVYNMKYDTMRFSPASTFKIFNSLVGLQTGRITDEKMIIKWVSFITFHFPLSPDLIQHFLNDLFLLLFVHSLFY